MEGSAAVAALLGVHPKKVAKLFGVHLRTVFRWITGGRLRAANGLVDRAQVAGSLPPWQASCSLEAARKRLRVRAATISSWRRKGLLESVTVLGFERVTLASVEKMEKRRKSRVFLVKPGYVRKSRLLESLGLNNDTLTSIIQNGLISSIEVNGIVLMPEPEVEAAEKLWAESCYPAHARRLLGVTKAGLRRLIRKGEVSEVTVLGIRRILREGLPAEIVRTRLVKGEGTKRLTTPEEVAKAAGKSAHFIEEQYRTGNVRGFEKSSGQIFLYASSAELLVKRLRLAERPRARAR